MTGKTVEGLSVRARAKVNLYLHILGQRQDGYHELDSLIVFADVADVIDVRPSKTLRFRTKGPFAASLPPSKDNLITRAARLLADAAQIKPCASITLTKNLPIAAGIGGGSADAAAALRALAMLWKIPKNSVDLPLLGLGLGADIPACLLSEPCFVGGIGELVERAPELPELHMVLVNPGEELPTGSVFRELKGKRSRKARFAAPPKSLNRLVSLLENRQNDLEKPAFRLCKSVSQVLRAMRATKGCRLARMSGSGATCFGLYEDADTAAAAADILRRKGWWAEATVTASAEFPVDGGA